ncbi:MAG: hypothetical protein ACREAW_02040 [Nitrososphaera sp.]
MMAEPQVEMKAVPMNTCLNVKNTLIEATACMIRIEAIVDLQAAIRPTIQIAQAVIRAIRAAVLMAVLDKGAMVRMVILVANILPKASFCPHMQK